MDSFDYVDQNVIDLIKSLNGNKNRLKFEFDVKYEVRLYADGDKTKEVISGEIIQEIDKDSILKQAPSWFQQLIVTTIFDVNSIDLFFCRS
jgi:hypothetical protein